MLLDVYIACTGGVNNDEAVLKLPLGKLITTGMMYMAKYSEIKQQNSMLSCHKCVFKFVLKM